MRIFKCVKKHIMSLSSPSFLMTDEQRLPLFPCLPCWNFQNSFRNLYLGYSWLLATWREPTPPACLRSGSSPGRTERSWCTPVSSSLTNGRQNSYTLYTVWQIKIWNSLSLKFPYKPDKYEINFKKKTSDAVPLKNNQSYFRANILLCMVTEVLVFKSWWVRASNVPLSYNREYVPRLWKMAIISSRMRNNLQ